MSKTLAIARRELLSLFCSPIGYIVIAGFLFVTGLTLWSYDGFSPGKVASLRSVFAWPTPLVLAFLLPAISMRMLSEEFRTGTIEMLLTAPISESHVVIGKYLAGVAFYAIMLAGTLVYLIAMLVVGNPDLMAAVSAYLGMLLVGAAFLSVGVLASSLTPNQIVAWIVAVVPLMLAVWFGTTIPSRLEGVARRIAQQLDVMRHVDQFSQGIIVLDSVVLFLVVAAVFLFFTVKVVESWRWR